MTCAFFCVCLSRVPVHFLCEILGGAARLAVGARGVAVAISVDALIRLHALSSIFGDGEDVRVIKDQRHNCHMT